jgi:hypothetical protein
MAHTENEIIDELSKEFDSKMKVEVASERQEEVDLN